MTGIGSSAFTLSTNDAKGANMGHEFVAEGSQGVSVVATTLTIWCAPPRRVSVLL